MKNILVNITGRIVGPYTGEEVIRNLLNKRLLPVHEVLWPCGRWVSISSHPYFAEVCAAIANLNVNDQNIEELTHSFTASLGNKTHSDLGSGSMQTAIVSRENTESVLAAAMDETQEVGFPQLEEEEGTAIFFPPKKKQVTDTNLESKTSLKKTSGSLDALGSSGSSVLGKSKLSKSKLGKSKLGKSKPPLGRGSTYVSPSDNKEKLAIWKLNKTWWISLCVCFFIVLGFLWQRQYLQIRNSQQLKLTLAEQLFKKNQFKGSLNLYKQVITLSEANKLNLPSSAYENYALLLLLVDQGSFEVRELLNTFLKTSPNKQRLLILSYLSSGNAKQALDVLNSIANKKTEDWLNIVNVYYMQGFYLKSLQILNQLKEKEALMLRLLVYIGLYQKTLDSNWLAKAKKLLNVFKDSFYYKQKLSLLTVYIHFLAGEKPSKQDIVSILNQDPYLEQNMKANLFIYSNLWSWSNLNSYCERLASSSQGELVFKTLKVFCLSKGKKKKDNWAFLLESLDRSKDILVGSVLTYVYKQEALRDKYVVKLAHLTESAQAKSSFLLLNLELRYCVNKKDKPCIKDRVRDLLSIKPKALFALFHRMKLYQSQGLKAEAKEIQDFFQNQVPDYKIF